MENRNYILDGEEIQQALENVKEGKVKPIEQIAKELGIVLR